MKKESGYTSFLNKTTLGGVVGNILEWYDFAVFGYFAPIIAKQFFPTEDPVAGLINTFGVFAAGYLVRPLGGVVFGHIGDRMGRKHALQLSVLLMVIPSTMIGLLPTYEHVGILAPILLILIRLIQGFSVGGELIGSISYMTEIAPPEKRGFLGSFAFMSAVGGVLLGSLVATIMHLTLDSTFLNSWGWRIPFLFGFLVGIYGLWMRNGLAETKAFQDIKQEGKIVSNPVKEVLTRMPLRVIHLISIIMINAAAFYSIFVWWPTYITRIVDPPIDHALTVNSVAMILFMFLVPVFGALSDKFGRKKLMTAGITLFLLLLYPLFVWTDQGVFSHAVLAQFSFTFVMAMFVGPICAMMIEMFPAAMRFSGIALGYNIAQSLVGGTSPLICTWLISKTGDIASPSYYLIAVSVVSLVGVLLLDPKYGKEIKT